MHFQVEIAQTAQQDILDWAEVREKEEDVPRSRSLQALQMTLATLRDFARRNPSAPENGALPMEIRQILLGKYRLLYGILGNRVVVLHLRYHHAMTVHSKGGP